jgi:glycosyltransferase involved in cell wall biosynthesis
MTPDEAHPSVSVVVPTVDRSAVLGDCLEALVAQAHDDYEVIVVDDGSRDGTRALVERFAERDEGPAIRYTRLEGQGAGAARNAGIALSRAELVCFVDDDALPPSGWLSALVAGAARHPEAEGLGGPVRPRFDGQAPRTCRAHDLAGAHLDCGPEDTEVDEVWGCNMAVRRSAVDRIGVFDERLKVAEDWDWLRRLRAAGGQVLYLPEAWIVHRRLASDLRVPGLAVEYCRRGYVVATRDASVASPTAARGFLASLAHAARRRCTRGLTDAMWRVGFLAGRAAARTGLAGAPHRS